MTFFLSTKKGLLQSRGAEKLISGIDFPEMLSIEGWSDSSTIIWCFLQLFSQAEIALVDEIPSSVMLIMLE